MIERNWEGIKQAREFLLKTEFFFCLFDQSKNRLDRSNHEKTKNFEKFGKLFYLKNRFYDMRCMFMISNVLQNQIFLRKIQTLANSINLFFLHSPKMH